MMAATLVSMIESTGTSITVARYSSAASIPPSVVARSRDCLSESGVFGGDIYMQRSASLSLARTIENQFYPIKGAWGSIAPSLEPKKNGTEENGKTRRVVADKKPADAIVAFSRPPPLPPVLGPLVALTLINPWSKQDSNNDS